MNCPAGSYQDNKGQKICKLCPNGSTNPIMERLIVSIVLSENIKMKLESPHARFVLWVPTKILQDRKPVYNVRKECTSPILDRPLVCLVQSGNFKTIPGGPCVKIALQVLTKVPRDSKYVTYAQKECTSPMMDRPLVYLVQSGNFKTRPGGPYVKIALQVPTKVPRDK